MISSESSDTRRKPKREAERNIVVHSPWALRAHQKSKQILNSTYSTTPYCTPNNSFLSADSAHVWLAKPDFEPMKYRSSIDWVFGTSSIKKNGIRIDPAKITFSGSGPQIWKWKEKERKESFEAKRMRCHGPSNPKTVKPSPSWFCGGGKGKTLGNEHVKFSPLLFSSPPSSRVLYIVFLFLTPLPSTI